MLWLNGEGRSSAHSQQKTTEGPLVLAPRTSHGNGLDHRPSVPGNHDGFTFFDQFKEPGELGLGFMNIDLHTLSLVHFPS